MPQIGEEHWFDERLRREEWADPLLLLMAALVASEDGVHSALSMTRPEVALWVAGRERSRLQRGLASNAAKRLLVHLYACVILCRSLSHEEACAVAASEFAQLGTEYPNGGAGEAVEELKQRVGLSSISPPEGGQPAKVLARLQPDLLAGAFLLQADLRAETAMRMAHRPGKARDVAQMLIFTTRDFGADDDRPVEWLQKIIEKGEAEIDVLIEIEAALPVQTLAMRRLALAVGRMLVAWARKKLDADGTIGSASRLAFYLNNCSLCESAVGDRNGALQSIREAVEIRRNLHDAYPDAFAPGLATSLNNLSIQQSYVGDREGALASSRESVAIRRKLHGANPDAFAPDLAMSLNNLSNRQSEVGDGEGALASIRDSVELYRKLHGANPDAFAPGLASSLNNLSDRQSEVGDRNGALASIRESVDLYRRLHGANPDAFATEFARSLSFLGDRLRENELKVEARDAAEESLRVLRPDFERLPKGFRGFEKATVMDYVRRSEELGLEVDEELMGVYAGLFEEEGG
jgi:tetratricopeptide (TPR) repeat protein